MCVPLLLITIINLVSCSSSLVPRPFRRRKGLVHIACAYAGGPQKKTGGIRYYRIFFRLSSIELHDMQNPRAITMEMRLVSSMEMPAHAPAICTRPFLLLLKGLGTRLVLQMPLFEVNLVTLYIYS